MTSQLNWDAASAASSITSRPRSARCSKAVSDRLYRALRSAFIEDLRQLREPADLTDHKPAKLHQRAA